MTLRSVLESLDESVDFILQHPEFAGWPKAREDCIQSIIKNAKLKGKAKIKYVIPHNTSKVSGHGNNAWKGREVLGAFDFSKTKNETQPFYPWGFRVLDKWLQIKIKGYSLETYFEENEIKHIAIYGMGAIGRRLYEEILQGQIKVCYGIDRNADNIIIDGLEMKTLEDKLPDVEAVVVTPVDFYQIEQDIYRKMGGNVNIIFIEDVVDYCLNLV